MITASAPAVIAAKAVRKISSARDRLGEAERGGHEDAPRSLAHARDIGGAADDHLDAGCFGRGRLVRRLGRDLRARAPAALQRAQSGDRLAALDVAAAEIEDARHQPFIFLA